VDVSCSNAPIVQDGKVTAGVIVVHDISARKQAEERLRHAQKLESIGLLAGGIAHDFNNILTGIMGIASLIQQDAPPEIADQLGTIVSGAERAAHLTRQLLAYAGKGGGATGSATRQRRRGSRICEATFNSQWATTIDASVR
jgi:signal transduction histidine kinase